MPVSACLGQRLDLDGELSIGDVGLVVFTHRNHVKLLCMKKCSYWSTVLVLCGIYPEIALNQDEVLVRVVNRARDIGDERIYYVELVNAVG